MLSRCIMTVPFWNIQASSKNISVLMKPMFSSFFILLNRQKCNLSFLQLFHQDLLLSSLKYLNPIFLKSVYKYFQSWVKGSFSFQTFNKDDNVTGSSTQEQIVYNIIRRNDYESQRMYNTSKPSLISHGVYLMLLNDKLMFFNRKVWSLKNAIGTF